MHFPLHNHHYITTHSPLCNLHCTITVTLLLPITINHHTSPLHIITITPSHHHITHPMPTQLHLCNQIIIALPITITTINTLPTHTHLIAITIIYPHLHCHTLIISIIYSYSHNHHHLLHSQSLSPSHAYIITIPNPLFT